MLIKKLTENDVIKINSLLIANYTYGEIERFMNLRTSDVRLLKILLVHDFKHIAEQFNQLRGK